jgi:hypothetical protein
MPRETYLMLSSALGARLKYARSPRGIPFTFSRPIRHTPLRWDDKVYGGPSLAGSPVDLRHCQISIAIPPAVAPDMG